MGNRLVSAPKYGHPNWHRLMRKRICVVYLRQRHPFSSAVVKQAREVRPLSWSWMRYVLCEAEMKYCVNGLSIS